jgi:very-short-patch-repair endonuclease
MVKLEAALRRLPVGTVFCGVTAAALHGLEVAHSARIEVNVPVESGVAARSGMDVRRCTLHPDEVVRVNGFPATSIVRTVAELGMRLPLVEGVVVADGALHARRLNLEQLVGWASAHSGSRGIRRLRRVIDLAEPATESPMETRLRMLLIGAGLPKPKAQVKIYDSSGRVVGRLDLYYEKERLGIEYDGATHRDSLAEDNRRQNNLQRAGVLLLRFTAGDVLRNPLWVVATVRGMLAAARVSTLGSLERPA